MSERIADKMGTAGAIAVAAACILAYSLWGASVMRAERAAPFSSANTQAQVARGN
jgi:hypothetical protein